MNKEKITTVDDIAITPIDENGVQFIYINTAIVGFLRRLPDSTRILTIHDSWASAAKIKVAKTIGMIPDKDHPEICRLPLHLKNGAEGEALFDLLSDLLSPATSKFLSGGTIEPDGTIEIVTHIEESALNGIRPTKLEYGIEMECGICFPDTREGQKLRAIHQSEHKDCKFRRVQILTVPLHEDFKDN